MSDEQPTDLPTTFTVDNFIYGVDRQGTIWRRKANQFGWVEAAKLPPVAPEDA